MDCKVCFEKYDKFEHKPIVIMPCGHTFCQRCLFDLKNKAFICPTCRQEIKSKKPNYDLLEVLDMNLVVDSNGSLKQEITNLTKNINDSKVKFHLNCEQKLQENRTKFQLIKFEINQSTNQLINLIKENQEKLLYKADNIQNSLNQQIKIYLNDKSFDLKQLDLNQLPTNELTIFKDELNVIKEDLELKTNQLNDLVSKYEFKPNENSISTKIIGDISEQKLSSNEVGH